MTDELINKNYDWFKKNLNELVKKYNGLYVVVKNNSVIASYNSFDEAFVDMSEKEQPGTFIIQLCTLDSEKTTQTFFTNRASF